MNCTRPKRHHSTAKSVMPHHYPLPQQEDESLVFALALTRQDEQNKASKNHAIQSDGPRVVIKAGQAAFATVTSLVLR
jgi:hypothetical protein